MDQQERLNKLRERRDELRKALALLNPLVGQLSEHEKRQLAVTHLPYVLMALSVTVDYLVALSLDEPFLGSTDEA